MRNQSDDETGGLPYRRMARVDFHLHSYASNVTDYYASNSLAIPESYSDPIETHRVLKARGMELVTLTDHNSIDGVRVMLDAGLPDVFISAEMTARFPEDGCNIHVTAANLSEAEFAELQRLRSNVYEMVAYLDERIRGEAADPAGRRLAYFMTHPLMSTQNRPYGRDGALSLWHIERALLLFDSFEVRNGTRARTCNTLTAQLIDSLDEKRLIELANKHDLAPKGERPWLKGVVAGSDDHSGINPGRTWTEFPVLGDAPQPNDVIDAIRRRVTRAAGMHGGPVTLAHALVKLLYDGQHSRHRKSDAPPMRLSDPINQLLGFAFEKDSAPLAARAGRRARSLLRRASAPLVRRVRGADSFEAIFLEEADRLLGDPSFRKRIGAAQRADDKIFLVISTLLDRLFARYAARVRTALTGDVVRAIKESVALVSSNLLVSLPYFASHAIHSSDRLLTRDVRRAFELRETEKLLLVTDTFFEVNGVALTIRRLIREADERGIDLTVVTCLSAAERMQRLAEPKRSAECSAPGRRAYSTKKANQISNKHS